MGWKASALAARFRNADVFVALADRRLQHAVDRIDQSAQRDWFVRGDPFQRFEQAKRIIGQDVVLREVALRFDSQPAVAHKRAQHGAASRLNPVGFVLDIRDVSRLLDIVGGRHRVRFRQQVRNQIHGQFARERLVMPFRRGKQRKQDAGINRRAGRGQRAE
jgi:hypothetical protein